MAVDARERRKTAYRNSIYVQGNTARKLEVVPARQEAVVRRNSNRARKNRDKALHMNVGYVLFLAVAMIIAGFTLTSYLTLQSDITNSIKHISVLESQYNSIKMENDENYSRITSNVNLEEVRRIAIQELGMVYAGEGQIVTFHGEGSDYVRQTGNIPD